MMLSISTNLEELGGNLEMAGIHEEDRLLTVAEVAERLNVSREIGRAHV